MKHQKWAALVAAMSFLLPAFPVEASAQAKEQTDGRVRADFRQHRPTAGGWQKAAGDVLAHRKSPRQLPAKAAAARSESEGLTLWGDVIYARSWEPEDALPQYGVFAYNLGEAGNYLYATPVMVDDQLRANGSGTFYDGVYHFMLYDIWSYYQEWDINTWQPLRQVEDNSKRLLATDTDYDVITGLSYGCYFNPQADAYEFAAVDYATSSKFVRRPCDLYIAIAINSQGEVYGIKVSDSSLYRIDKATGEETLIGNTGIDVGDYLQSATFDRTTDVLYWACNDAYGESYLCRVDTETGRATKLSIFADREQISSLYIPRQFPDDVPAQADALEISFPKGQLSGNVSFVLPTEYRGGASLTGESLHYALYANATPIASGEGKAGEKVSVDATVPEGFSLIRLQVSNANGRGEETTLRQWFGTDVPHAPTGVKLSLAGEFNNEAHLTWAAPKTGVHDGYVDASALTYDIVRYPDSLLVAQGISATEFSEVIDVNRPGVYHYGVKAIHDGKTGEEALSGNGTTQGVLGIPYFEGFDTKDAFRQYQILDANGDDNTWTYNTKVCMAQYSCNWTNAADDWLISPEIAMNGGRMYRLEFIYKGFDDRKPEQMSVRLGQGDAPTAYREIVPAMTIGNYDRLRHESLFAVEADGKYRLAFHAESPADAYYLYLDSIAITEYALSDAPVAASGLTVEPYADGVAAASLRCVAPSLTNAGEALQQIDKVEVVRDGSVVHVFSPVEPGATLTWDDTAVPDGFHTYVVRAWNASGKGAETESRVFVGQDLPLAPQQVRLTDQGGTLLLTWEKPSDVGVNGQYVHTPGLRYSVYTSSLAGVLTPYREDLSETSVTIADAYADGAQQMVSFVVRAKSPAGEGDRAVSNSLIGGSPYALPFLESFPGGEAPATFWLSQGYNPFRLADNISYNDDGGCIGWKSNGFDHEGWMSSGKIRLTDAQHPTFIYAYYALPTEEMKLETSVIQHDGTETVVDVLDFAALTGAEGWRVRQVDLSAFTGEPFVLLQLHAAGTDILTPIYMDHFRVEDLTPGRNLRISAIGAPAEVQTQHPAHLSCRVENAGSSDVSDFRVRFYVDDAEAGCVEAAELPSCEGVTCRLDYCPPVSPDGSHTARVRAEVECDGDDVAADNVSPSAEMAVRVPDYPAITDLAIRHAEGNGALTLTWSEPAQAAQPRVESFETYLHKENQLAPWLTVDVEQGQTYTNTTMDAGYSNVEASFWVFNPYVAAVAPDNLPNYLPQDGRQCLMAVASQQSTIKHGNRNDDWLISPEVGAASAQTVRFYAKAAKENYGGGEPFEVHASSSYPEVDCFERLASYVAPGAWTAYQAELPVGTRYFAIRYTGTDDNFMFLLDNIQYSTGVMSVEGYRVYADGRLVGETDAATCSYEVADAGATYAVTVVYGNGESGFSNAVALGSGVEQTVMPEVSSDCYTLSGLRLPRKAAAKGVYITSDGKKLIVR